MSQSPFIGRQKEIDELKLLFEKRSASFVVVQGRRRIGKSRLIAEFGKHHKFYSFTGLPPTEETTAQSQRDYFALQLGEAFGLPGLKSEDWSSLFNLLAIHVQNQKVILLFDEISWMGSKDPDFLGKLKKAWDLQFKENPNLILILCGSVSPWIEKNILSNTGFVGRISLVIYLEELPLQDCSRLLSTMGSHWSAYEKFKVLSVTGGVPRYLEEIQPSMAAEENIKRLCFSRGGVLFRDFDDIFSDLFEKRATHYKQIIELLVDKSLDFNEICDGLNVSKSGHVSEYLDNLIKSKFISRDFTWNLHNEKESSLSKYRLSDNYTRFYLKIIEKNKNGHYSDISVVSIPGWESMIGLQFENLVLNNRDLVCQKLHVTKDLISNDNAFFQRKTVKSKGCQIDYLIQTKLNALYICEIKFSKRPIGLEIVEEMKNKIDALMAPKYFSRLPVLIHVNGVEDSVVESGYFSKIIDFSEFLT